MIRGKEVPCFCRWSEKGGITSEILRDILQTLDKLDLFPRVNGVRPFLLLDGHGSRFELPFLAYINDPEHEWIVVIGVPYGTALWQVGDAPEQNGTFNMESVKAKRNIVDTMGSMMITPTIHPHDIMTIINAAWDNSFARVDTNKKAISERGWVPFNRNLMTYPIKGRAS